MKWIVYTVLIAAAYGLGYTISTHSEKPTSNSASEHASDKDIVARTKENTHGAQATGWASRETPTLMISFDNEIAFLSTLIARKGNVSSAQFRAHLRGALKIDREAALEWLYRLRDSIEPTRYRLVLQQFLGADFPELSPDYVNELRLWTGESPDIIRGMLENTSPEKSPKLAAAMKTGEGLATNIMFLAETGIQGNFLNTADFISKQDIDDDVKERALSITVGRWVAEGQADYAAAWIQEHGTVLALDRVKLSYLLSESGANLDSVGEMLASVNDRKLVGMALDHLMLTLGTDGMAELAKREPGPIVDQISARMAAIPR